MQLRIALDEVQPCNGCGRPRREWGPICGGMTQGDMTHYYSASYWEQRLWTEQDRLDAELADTIQHERMVNASRLKSSR